MEPSSSPKFSINGIDFYKALRGGAVMFLGYILVATLTAFQVDVTSGVIDPGSMLPEIPGLDLKTTVNGLVISAASTALEMIRRFITNYEQ